MHVLYFLFILLWIIVESVTVRFGHRNHHHLPRISLLLSIPSFVYSFLHAPIGSKIVVGLLDYCRGCSLDDCVL
ncbi:hypothetical protein VNO80_29321 [Phaseolus coccineus]|uniref:Secreted peptide n=1 Tax=Phaseolus coccineus TaxID=3886 RepID=A0AAN9QID4_PHACN